MPKNIIVSNRLPIQITIDKNTINLKGSVGGLATGMKSVHEDGFARGISGREISRNC